MEALQIKTCADALRHPIFYPVDMSRLTMKQIAEVLRKEFGTDPFKSSHAKPETHALEFYLANHVVGLIRTNDLMKSDDPLLVDLCSRYTSRAAQIAGRAFAYLYLICARELRHCKGASMEKCKIHLDGEIEAYGRWRHGYYSHATAVVEFVWENGGYDNLPVGDFVGMMEKVYRYGSWGGAYGGPKWADIALCMKNYLNGTYTAEMMVDTVWTLSHNTAPIFNKGMLYDNYTQNLMRVLDVQRAGQVPNYAWDSALLSTWFKDFHKLAGNIFPELNAPADIDLIRKTAVHQGLWNMSAKFGGPGNPGSGPKPNVKTLKPGTHPVAVEPKIREKENA